MILVILLQVVIIVTNVNVLAIFINQTATIAFHVDVDFFENDLDREFYVSEVPRAIEELIQNYMKFTALDVKYLTDLKTNLRKDYIILITIMDCQKTWSTLSKAKQEELIYIAVTNTPCPRIPAEDGFSIPFTIQKSEISQIIFDLRSNVDLNWRKINVIYENSTNSQVEEEISELFSKNKYLDDDDISTTLFAIENKSNRTAVKEKLDLILKQYETEESGRRFVSILSHELVPVVQEMAKLKKLMTPEDEWLFIIENKNDTFNVTEFIERIDEGENLCFIYKIPTTQNCDENVMCRIKQVIKILAMTIDVQSARVSKHDNKTKSQYLKSFKMKNKISISHSMKQYFKKNHNKTCSNCYSWNVRSSLSWGMSYLPKQANNTFLDVGSWTLEFGVTLWDNLFPNRKYGFRRSNLPITTFHNPPWQIVDITSVKDKKYSGLVFDIINHLAKKLNFTVDVKLSVTDETKNNMKIHHKNNLSQMVKLDEAAMSTAQIIPEKIIRLVIDKKVFLGACASSTIKLFEKGVQFTLPISMQPYSLLAPNPVLLSRAMLFIAPFTSETWATLLGSIFVVAPVLYVIQKADFDIDIFPENQRGFHTLWQSVWYIYGALLQQGGSNLPVTSSARLIVGMWWLVVMVIVAMYSGTLVAFLTFPRMDEAVLSINDLLYRKDEFSWGFPNGSIVEDYMISMGSEKYLEFVKRAERHNTTEVSSIIKKIKGKKHVLLDWTMSLRFLMRTDYLLTGQCYFTLSKTEVLNEPIALLVEPSNPYIKLINNELERLHESGLIKKWTSHWMPSKDQCWDGNVINLEAKKHKVNMSDMQGIFFVLAIGFTFAVNFICCEFIIHKRKMKKNLLLIKPFIN